jgi:hypothetical protein
MLAPPEARRKGQPRCRLQANAKIQSRKSDISGWTEAAGQIELVDCDLKHLHGFLANHSLDRAVRFSNGQRCLVKMTVATW